ncbi:transforming growth factor-beta-induced protein ig-h3 [Stomoxys calcitrans]|uniref:transforming growth factor-beta-induced protein ig-h3 n=1 Tax=Stomoxys calcitrans TaxID=35570 RepID=UPI0027E234D0|nr:transforming growth factor-beta-induced protein ig-h3 [Stomoxys calcitrans]XP_059218391.1 transforming growth factor-beta-induced protein ig-h3 [Stomoxys calcitrans]
MKSTILPLGLLLTLFTVSNVTAQYFSSYEPEAEFVPLEAHNNPHNGRNAEEKPFEVDVITSDVNGGGNNQAQPGLFLHQSFPFFGNNFLNSFGGFGIGTQEEPWWKGPNVCTEKEEDEKDMEASEETDETQTAEGSETIKQPTYGQFQFSLNSCVEKPNKYVCTRVVNKNGKKKTLTISRQCCHGYGRPRNAAYATPCEKIDIKDIEATAADMGAKEFVAKAKSSGLADTIKSSKNVTIFLPMDEAFNAYSDTAQSENNLVEMKTDDGMKQLFLRHVVDGEINLEDVGNEQVFKTHAEGQTIRINSYQMPLTLSREPYRYTANCVPIVKRDKLSEQGMVHTLSGVIPAASKNIMDLIRERSDMSIMRTVLENTKLSELLEGDKPVSIFVPNDSAFDKLEPHLRRALKEGKGCASNILKNHMLDLTFCTVASVAGAKTIAYNLLGEPMRFNRTKSESAAATATEGKTEVEVEQPVIINGIAKIMEADIMGSNGVMHVIDTIMPTESALPLSSLMQEKNVTLFKRLLEASGMDNTFDDLDNVTVFAPTDKALQTTKWPQLLEESPEQLRDNPELAEFLNYHVIKPMIKTCDLEVKQLPTINGDKVRINLYSTHALFSNVMNRATVNCARLIHFDDESCGSVMHQVDKPLTPAKSNLLQVLESNPNYSKFLDLVRMANLTDLLANAEEDYTLLVPKNDVFEELEDSLPKEQSELESLIKTHIVNDVVCCAGIIPTNWPFVRSIESLNGHHLRITRDRRPKIQNAGITKCDGIATNGIIHEINDVIVPNSRKQQLQPQQQQQHHQIPEFSSTHHQHGQRPQHHHYPNADDIFGDLFF